MSETKQKPTCSKGHEVAMTKFASTRMGNDAYGKPWPVVPRFELYCWECNEIVRPAA